MIEIKKIRDMMRRQIGILLVPQADMPPWRFQVPFSFLVFGGAVWLGVTAWAAYVTGRNIDYWITKADNQILRAKVAYFADEVNQSREFLKMARHTDAQLRTLLDMKSRRVIVEQGEALGGPGEDELIDVKALLASKGKDIRQQVLRRQALFMAQETRERLASFQEIAWYISNQRNKFQSTPNIWPTDGRITSRFGYRLSPFRGGEHEREHHPGIDIANSADTPVVATADGAVRRAGWTGGYGNMILIDHGYGFSTLYGHTSKALVKEGDWVRRGQVIAYMGTTGRSTNHHLHYEVRHNRRPVNPLSFLAGAPSENGAVARLPRRLSEDVRRRDVLR